MARVIVGADEDAGDVARRLLELADHQNDVQTRTDGSGLSYEVPDKVYDQYVGKGKRSTDEQRVNSVQRMIEQQGADDPDKIVSGDQVPDSATVAEPGDGADEIAGELNGDQLPDSAVVVDPPANGRASNAGDGPDPGDGDGDQGDTVEPETPPTPKPRKRASRARTAKSTPAAAAGDDK